MENNLDDVLIDNLEEKAPKKSNKRIILIIVASVVLLGVLGVSSLMLAKQEPAPKNLEFNELEAELEKLSPPLEEPKQNKQEDEFDKLIADIKNRQAQEDSKPNITPAIEAKKPAIKAETTKTQIEPQANKAVNPEHKIDLQLEDLAPSTPAKKEVKEATKASTPKSQAPKVAPKANESKPQKVQKEKVVEAPKKSASQLFQSVEKSVPKGFYLQVGVFGGNPQASFLNKLRAYPYKSEKIQRSGKVLTRYLIGPFTSKEMAASKIEEVTQAITKPVIVEIR